MSKSSKKKGSQQRKQAKRALRATKQAQYSAWAADGMNKKSKRFAKKSRSGLVADSKHDTNFCGNVACSFCFPTMSQHNIKVYRKPIERVTAAQFKNKQRAAAAQRTNG